MEDIQALIDEKKARVATLKGSAPTTRCSSSHSSGQDVNREMEIEELEDEIYALEKKLLEKNK